jgi:hypothetical protein
VALFLSWDFIGAYAMPHILKTRSRPLPLLKQGGFLAYVWNLWGYAILYYHEDALTGAIFWRVSRAILGILRATPCNSVVKILSLFEN